jgi:flagellar basal-body rod protein FlgB
MNNHPINLFKGTIETLSRALDLRSRKHEMILNNVANADTPNYKPFAMNVEAALQENRQPIAPGKMEQTDDRHLPGQPMIAEKSAGREAAADNPLLLRGDRNGVDIDVEMAALAKNSLLYKASAQIVSSKFKGLKNVISGGNK